MICPSCHNEVEVLERNYGMLFTCPECQVVYFVNFDGHPEFSEELYEAPVVSADRQNTAEPFGTNEIANNFSFQPETFAEIPAADAFQPAVERSAFGDLAQEITDFGNSEVQITALNYSLEIRGLDSKEDVRAFEETITDSRFGWDVNDVMKQLQNGKIILEKLNPVQAFILHKRIYFLDFDLKWTQHVLE